MGLIAPENLPPPSLTPGLVLLGPVQAAELLGVGEEGLGGGDPGRDAKLLLDDPADCPLGDDPETRNETLEPVGSEEGIVVKLLLDFPLEGIVNLPKMNSRDCSCEGRGGPWRLPRLPGSRCQRPWRPASRISGYGWGS